MNAMHDYEISSEGYRVLFWLNDDLTLSAMYRGHKMNRVIDDGRMTFYVETFDHRQCVVDICIEGSREKYDSLFSGPFAFAANGRNYIQFWRRVS